MNYNVVRLSTLGLVTMLAACGGSNKTVLQPGPNGLPYAVPGLKADVTTMAGTYANVPFKADTSNATLVENGGTVSPLSAGTADLATTITIRNNSTIDVKFGNGSTTRFTRVPGGTGGSGSITGDEWRNSSGTITGIFALAGDLSATTINSIFFGYLGENSTAGGTTQYSDSFIMSGFETNPTELTGLPSATYNGPAQVVLRRANSTDAPTPEYLIDNGNGTTLTANFAGKTLTGTLSGTTSTNLGAEPITLNVTATINGNGFTGGFTESGANNITLNGTQSLAGNFYGVDALELGGTLSSGIASNGGTVPQNTLASGFFIGKR